MAGMFYSLEEVAAKLNVSENQIKEFVNQGKLREFQDGPNQLFKVDEVEALQSELQGQPPKAQEGAEKPDDEDISLEIGDSDVMDAQADSNKDIPADTANLELDISDDTSAQDDQQDQDTGRIELELNDDAQAEPEQKKPEQPEQAQQEDTAALLDIDLDDDGDQPADDSGDADEQQLGGDSTGIQLQDKPDRAKPADDLQETTEELSLADTHDPSDETAAGSEGINILGDSSDSSYKLSDDTLGETRVGEDEASLEEIEDDVNLDSFGSGSGLLDLSLQADDTSLGGILDEIYAPEGEGQEQKGIESASGVIAEADSVMPDTTASAEVAAAGPGPTAVYAEPEPDTISNALGLMLFVPLAAVLFMAIVTISALGGTRPGILDMVQDFLWYVVGAMAVLALAIAAGGYVMESSSGKGPKKPKPEKPKKAKKEKAKKAKKK